MGLFAVLFVPQETITSSTGSNLFFTLTWLLLYFFVFILLLKHSFRMHHMELIILAIPLFHLLSVIWSPQPIKTLVYSFCFLLNSFFVIALRRYFKTEDIIKIIIDIILIMSLLGLLFYFFGYSNVHYYDIHDRGNIIGGEPLRGFFNHKITAGLYSAIAFNLTFIFFRSKKRLVYMAVLFLFNIMTGSATGLSLLLVGFLIINFLVFCRNKNIPSNAFLITISLLVSLVVLTFITIGTDILIYLERDPTLTGRTLLWTWGIEVGLEKPLLGWGYLGYLGTDIAGNVAETYTEFHNYDVPHFHNSLIQIFADGGIFYTIFIVLLIFTSIKYWYRDYLLNGNKAALAFCFLSLFLLVSSIFVYIYSRYNDFSTILFMLIIASMPKLKKFGALSE
jgi:O-antigen ligase